MTTVFVLAAVCIAAAAATAATGTPGFRLLAHLAGWSALGLSVWLNVLSGGPA